MFWRTHLAFSVLFLLLFLPHIESRFIFSIFVLIATFLPDIDSGFSTVGNNIFGKFLRFFVKHRGFIHSITFCVVLSVLLTLIFPPAALGFFLGYSLHLFLDSFTQEGIMPFWPLRNKSYWKIKTGGRVEDGLFLGFILADIMVLLILLV